MQKISIKREQSQAGLSFAEREKFRPQVKNKLLLLLALLLTAATGAWATDVYVVGNGNVDGNWVNGAIWDPGASDNKMTEQNGVYSITFKDVDANSELLFKFAINGTWDVNYGCTSTDVNELNKTLSNIDATGGMNFKFGLTEKADVTISFNLSEMTYMISTKGMKVGDDPATGYTVSLKDGVKDADKWTVKVGEGQAQALPIGGLKGDGTETVTLQYNGRLKVKGVKATSEAAPAGPTYNETKSINDGPVTVAAGEHWLITGTGTQTSNTMSIAAGATVTLDGVNIGSSGYCIKCLGDATIILKDNSTNTLTGTGSNYPALSIGDANTTLTIQGSTGVLNVTSGQYCAGIGGGYSNTNKTCGNIRIEGGVITAQGGQNGAGIGSDCYEANCGDIIITGGTITAKGGTNAAGIGTGYGSGNPAVCGAITIANTVTKVTATKGDEYAPHSIGKGNGDKASCGTVTIGGTVYWENNAAVNGGDTYLAQNPLIYDPSAPAKEPATVTTAPTGAAIVGVGKETALVSGGAAEGGTMMYKVTTENTKPASTDGFSEALPTAQGITASGKVYVWYYVKGNDTHSDSEIAATAIEVPVADIVWDVTNISDLEVYGTDEYVKEGVKLSGNVDDVDATWNNSTNPTKVGIIFSLHASGGFTFTAPTGKAFTKIEMMPNGPNGWDTTNLGSGWAFNNLTVTWTGSAASTVKLLTDVYAFNAAKVTSIAFYLSE